MDVQKMLEILKRDYGIESKEELIERFESSKGINIGIFTERRQTASRTVIEGAKQKERNLEIESYEHQIFDHLADLGLQELFEKKFGTWQCASIKGRGQLYTKKGVEKWIRTDPQGTKVAIQCDVRKCYQNIDIDVLIAMLERDIHKNKPLLWLTRKLLLIMKEKDKGLFVGSVISKDLANYYMSYLYHYAESELTVTRRSNRTKEALAC